MTARDGMETSRAEEVVTARCPKCAGDGWTAEHDCDGNEMECWSRCPVQMQCAWCRGEGTVAETVLTDEGDPDDQPF